MPSEETKILEFNQYQKSDKATSIIYADLECLIEQIDGCRNNPQNSFATKVSEHIPLGFLKIKTKNIEKLEIIVIIQGNIEMLHIAYVI